jgi:hypothetical protein
MYDKLQEVKSAIDIEHGQYHTLVVQNGILLLLFLSSLALFVWQSRFVPLTIGSFIAQLVWQIKTTHSRERLIELRGIYCGLLGRMDGSKE